MKKLNYGDHGPNITTDSKALPMSPTPHSKNSGTIPKSESNDWIAKVFPPEMEGILWRSSASNPKLTTPLSDSSESK